MSGQTTFKVVEPEFQHELFSRLLHAAAVGTTATFEAVSEDDPREQPERHNFTVRVKTVHFELPCAFDVTDQDMNIFQIKLFKGDRPTFTVFYH